MSDETLFLKPGPGRRVRKPDGTLLAEPGETVRPSTYWTRRLADEDVVVGPPQSSPSAKPAKPPVTEPKS